MHNEKTKIWILSELFYPETTSTAYYLTEIAKQLSKKYAVEVICGTPVYDRKIADVKLEGININRIKSIDVDKNNLIKRLLRAILLSIKMCNFLKKNWRQNEKVLFVTNPVFLTLSIPKWTYKKHIDTTIIVNDVFPENATTNNILKKNSLIFKILKKKFDSSYSKVSRCIVCGNDMNEIIKEKTCNKIPVITIENWGDSSKIQPLYKKKENITIQFAGNLGRVQGLLDFLELIKNVKNPLLQFEFVGSGAARSKMEDFKSSNDLENVVFLPPYSRDDEEEILNRATISLVCLKDKMFGLGVPSKSYNVMAAGRPILFIGPKNSEIYNMVKDNEIGFSFDWSQREEIISFLNNLQKKDIEKFNELGKKARHLLETQYDKEIILNKYLEVV